MKGVEVCLEEIFGKKVVDAQIFWPQDSFAC